MSTRPLGELVDPDALVAASLDDASRATEAAGALIDLDDEDRARLEAIDRIAHGEPVDFGAGVRFTRGSART